MLVAYAVVITVLFVLVLMGQLAYQRRYASLCNKLARERKTHDEQGKNYRERYAELEQSVGRLIDGLYRSNERDSVEDRLDGIQSRLGDYEENNRRIH